MRINKLYLVLCVICILLLAVFFLRQAADSPVSEEEKGSSVYSYDALGLSITVPPGWQVNKISEQPQSMDYADGGSRLELLDIQSTADSSDPTHSRFYAYAELFAVLPPAEQYVDLLEELLVSPGAPYSYELQKREEVFLSRHPVERLCFTVSTAGHEQPYTEEYYVVQLGAAFVVFYVNYWPQNEDSRTAAWAMLDNISLP